MTCCALHNLLLDVDGLSHKWEEGVPCSYETADGQFQDEDIPDAVRRLVDPTGWEGSRLQLYDSSRFGFRNRDDDDDHDDHLRSTTTNHSGGLQLPLVESGTASVSLHEFNQFRTMLIDYFNIAFHLDDLKWPKRYGENSRPVSILSTKQYYRQCN